MITMASQITSLTVVYSTVYSDADQTKHQSSASLAFVWGIHWDRWIPRTKGQLRGKCFHLMTSSCYNTALSAIKVNLAEKGKRHSYLTTTKHDKAWTECIILGMKCMHCNNVEYESHQINTSFWIILVFYAVAKTKCVAWNTMCLVRILCHIYIQISKCLPNACFTFLST